MGAETIENGEFNFEPRYLLKWARLVLAKHTQCRNVFVSPCDIVHVWERTGST